ncbi:MAG: hypothetical protein A2Z46_05055 [Nitrospirae bacterium RBG_19FT_COMBO_55_12]|nr:MAG: hypothetical protein A2Z46_05055 [Nitrospirae bacterium RBG_19FT_COMBO_55_12]
MIRNAAHLGRELGKAYLSTDLWISLRADQRAGKVTYRVPVLVAAAFRFCCGTGLKKGAGLQLLGPNKSCLNAVKSVSFAMLNLESIKKPLAVLLLAAYMFVPLLDIVACDDCSDFKSLSQQESVFTNATKATPASLIGDDGTNGSAAAKKETNSRCPLCFNSSFKSSSFNAKNPLSSVTAEHQAVQIAFLDPSYPINKPPQN